MRSSHTWCTRCRARIVHRRNRYQMCKLCLALHRAKLHAARKGKRAK